MNIVEFSSKEYLNESVYKEILSFIIPSVRINIALFSGSTSIQIYDLLVNEIKDKPIYKNIHFYIHNEIPLLPEERGGLVINHIYEHFFSKITIDKENIHLLNESNYHLLEKEIVESGGIDLMILSVGDDGHIAANYPGAEVFTGIRKIKLAKEDGLYKSLLEKEKSHLLVSPHFYSYGIGTIMESKNISIVAYGGNKKEALDRIKNGVTDIMYPVTLLNEHNSCTLYTLIND